jgi:hypothetical protein
MVARGGIEPPTRGRRLQCFRPRWTQALALPGTSLALQRKATANYFILSQTTVRTVFLPVAGSFEGWVVSVRRSPSNL